MPSSIGASTFVNIGFDYVLIFVEAYAVSKGPPFKRWTSHMQCHDPH